MNEHPAAGVQLVPSSLTAELIALEVQIGTPLSSFRLHATRVHEAAVVVVYVQSPVQVACFVNEGQSSQIFKLLMIM